MPRYWSQKYSLENTMTKNTSLTLLIAATLTCSSAFAHDWDHDGWREHRHHGWDRREVVYVAPPVYAAPQVVYAQPVAYAPAPAYYVSQPVYVGSNRVVGQTVGAVAGGVIGSIAGRGQLLPTAVGAVIGGVVGGSLAE
jgi:hypothetical protein